RHTSFSRDWSSDVCSSDLEFIEETVMSDHTYKLVEIVGSSSEGTDAAIRNAIDTASKSIRHIDWFEVVETRGHVVDGKVGHFQRSEERRVGEACRSGRSPD